MKHKRIYKYKFSKLNAQKKGTLGAYSEEISV